MRSAGIGLGALATILVPAATPPSDRRRGTVVESLAPALLPPEKQKLICEQTRRADLPKVDLGEPARAGTIISPEVELLVLPQGMSSEVPTTTSYRYLVTDDAIAVVEPENRKIVQLIDR